MVVSLLRHLQYHSDCWIVAALDLHEYYYLMVAVAKLLPLLHRRCHHLHRLVRQTNQHTMQKMISLLLRLRYPVVDHLPLVEIRPLYYIGDCHISNWSREEASTVGMNSRGGRNFYQSTASIYFIFLDDDDCSVDRIKQYKLPRVSMRFNYGRGTGLIEKSIGKGILLISPTQITARIS